MNHESDYDFDGMTLILPGKEPQTFSTEPEDLKLFEKELGEFLSKKDTPKS